MRTRSQVFNGGDVVEVPGGSLYMHSTADEHPKELGAQPLNPMLRQAGLGNPPPDLTLSLLL
jgi:hypothetical protein